MAGVILIEVCNSMAGTAADGALELAVTGSISYIVLAGALVVSAGLAPAVGSFEVTGAVVVSSVGGSSSVCTAMCPLTTASTGVALGSSGH